MKTTVLLSFLMPLTIVEASSAEAGSMEKTISSFYQAVDAGDFDRAGDFLADDVKVSIPFVPQIVDKMTYKQIGMSMKSAFPDMRHQILEVTESKNTAAFKGIFSGANTGSLQGNPPSGNRVEQAFLGYLKFNKSGKINEVSLQFDVANFNAQLMKGLPDPKESLKQIGRDLLQQIDRHKLDGVIAHFSPDARFNGWAPQTLDAEGYRGAMSALLAAFPDARFTIDDVLADGDKVLVRHHLEGTHTGAAFQGVPAGGKKVYVNAVVTFRIENGKAAEAWLNADFLGMMMQLGAVPSGNTEPKN